MTGFVSKRRRRRGKEEESSREYEVSSAEPCRLMRLRLRLGTFNVNGKMPTQDLSAWIQGNVQEKGKSEKAASPSLPPVKGVSPLSMGGNNPFDWSASLIYLIILKDL